MKLFNALTAAAVIAASSFMTTPTWAGLGAAEGGTTNRTFDAYCGKPGNKCKVKFSGNRLTVNGTDGIDKGSIIRYQTSNDFWCTASVLRRNCRGSGQALVVYREDGQEGSGTFIFVNHKTFDQFKAALSAFCGGSCRPIGPSINIEN